MKCSIDQEHALRSSTRWSIYDSFTGLFLVPLVLVLGATNMEVGLIGAAPFIAMLFSQIPGVLLLNSFTRLQLYKMSTLTSRLLWIPIVLLSYNHRTGTVLAIAGVYFLIKFFESLSEPGYTTILGDIITKKCRGEFFGKRLWLMALFGTIAYIFAGFFLDRFDKTSVVGFTPLMLVGVLFGIWTTLCFTKIKEPKYIKEKHTLRTFFTMNDSYKAFCLFVATFHFAFMLAGPFYTVYMLRNLGLTYEFYVIALSMQTIARLASQQTLGKLSDRMSNRHLGALSVLGLALAPYLFTLITKDTLMLLLPIQLLLGVGIAGVNVILSNLVIDLTPDHHRAVGVVQYNLVLSLAIAPAPIIAGYISENAAVFTYTGIPAIFALSSILTLISIYFLYQLEEPKYPTQAKRELHNILRSRHSRPRTGAPHV